MSATNDDPVNHSATRNLATPIPAAPVPPRSLARAVYERRDEYLSKANVRIKIGSWNVAALDGTEKDLKSWFVQGKGVSDKLGGLTVEDADGFTEAEHQVESISHQEQRANTKEQTTPLNDLGSLPGETDIGLYVLGLQEIVDISSPSGALRPYHDAAPQRKWRDAATEALPPGYTLVAEQQLIGLYLLIYASPEVAKTVSSVSTDSVGTGVLGYMGNKGAVAARLVLGETTKVVFINSHLAAGNEKTSLERRNWDASQITHRAKFEPVDYGNGIKDEQGDHLGAEHFAFWFGDLNYRIGTLPGDDVRRLLTLHTKNEYDERKDSLVKIDSNLNSTESLPDMPSTPFGTSSTFVVSEDGAEGDANDKSDDDEDEYKPDPENDPTSLQTTLSSLLPHDQLHEQMTTHKAFHDGWHEGPLKFLPTYKYDVGSVGKFDSSEKRRGPSWCDRILFRTQKKYLAFLQHVKDDEQAKKRDAEMKARGLDRPSEEVLFDYNPDTDGTAEEVPYANDVGTDYDEYAEEPDPMLEDDVSLQLQYYTSHQRVLSSDHKPLDAIFDLTYDAVDHIKKAQITSLVAKELDRDENEGRPTLTLIVDQADHTRSDKGEIDFGKICFDDPKSHNLTIANTGSVTAYFGLVQDGIPGQHQWVDVKFGDEAAGPMTRQDSYALEPGDTMSATCILHVTNIEDVRKLNEGEATIDDVRILRIEGGRDHFITSHGTWQHSCFGLSLDKLIRVPEEGVRSCALDAELDEQPVRWSAPRELFRLTEALEEALERATAEWGIKEADKIPPWDTAGWPFVASTWTFTGLDRSAVKAAIRAGLDSGSSFSFDDDLSFASKVECLAETLIAFLGSISGGIIDSDLWTSLSTAVQEAEKAKKNLDPEAIRALILEELSVSSPRSVAFTFITFMLARVANEVAPVPAAVTPPEPATNVAGKAAELLKGTLSRRNTGGDQVAQTKRREVEKKFAECFVPVVFQIPGESRAKEKRSAEERRRNVLAVFLQSKGNDRSL